MTTQEILSQQIVLLQSKLDVQTAQYLDERQDDADLLQWLMKRVKILEEGLARVIDGSFFLSLEVLREQGRLALEDAGKLEGYKYKYPPCAEMNCPLSKREFISKV